MKTTHWKKVYKGPFNINDASKLAVELREKHLKTKVRMRRIEGSDTGWDVWMEVCKTCGGSGEITTMETLDPSEPHIQAPVGTAPCPDCQNKGE